MCKGHVAQGKTLHIVKKHTGRNTVKAPVLIIHTAFTVTGSAATGLLPSPSANGDIVILPPPKNRFFRPILRVGIPKHQHADALCQAYDSAILSQNISVGGNLYRAVKVIGCFPPGNDQDFMLLQGFLKRLRPDGVSLTVLID